MLRYTVVYQRQNNGYPVGGPMDLAAATEAEALESREFLRGQGYTVVVVDNHAGCVLPG